MLKCVEKFQQIYHTEPANLSFCPYRVCPVGAHVDHQLGKVTGLALDCGIHIAYNPKQNGVVELASLQFGKRAQFHVNSTPETKQGDWADYLRGVTLMLGARHKLRVGLAGVIEGSLPIGGLSSSAAVTIAFLLALAKVNDIRLEEAEIIQLAKAAENQYVGVSCGTLDQSCEVYCRKNQLLYLDTLDNSLELIPQPSGMKPYRIAIFFSGLERALASSKFNTRVDECRAAAYALLAYADMDYGKVADTSLRQVPREVFDQYGKRLPDAWQRRATHFFTEVKRAEQGANAWRKGDLEEFGRISFASGKSSIEQWESGSPELKELYRIMTETEGIYGGRFSGAGFKGCCMALIDPAFAESITQRVTEEYLRAFPALAGKFLVHICDSADGVGTQL